jgi:hypothetical protein
MPGAVRKLKGRLLPGVLLLALGAALAAAGMLQLQLLQGAFRQQDLRLTESPDTFKVWLALLAREQRDVASDVNPAPIARRIADRLGVMSAPLRRRVVINMARPAFWEDIRPPGSTSRAIKMQALEGVYLRLQTEPGAGDLYLAAASLETSLLGLTSRARRLLDSSQTFAPREFDLAVERLILASLVWTLLTEEERSRARRAFALVSQLHPDKAQEIARELESMGVNL